jgi:F-type H+-transporting ATPase subunit a
LAEITSTFLSGPFIYFAASVRRRGYAKGVFKNALEMILLFIRDNVAVPAIGAHDAKRFLPFLWSLFFFILACNLIGMIPFLGSPTGALGTTGALALCSFIMIHGSGVRQLGASGYAHAFVPAVPLALYPLMFVIELIGHIIKPTILAVRLFVNMLAGHTVLFVILGFIAMVGSGPLYYVVTPASVIGNVLLSMLELFVAFLQAYVFTFLTAIFIGAAVHPQH